MRATSRKPLLLVTAVVEAGTGLCLLVVPAVLFAILLGSDPISLEASLVGRIAGAALIAIGVASWIASADTPTSSQRGLLIGILIYNGVASVLLAFAGIVLKMIGVLLWPALAFHVVLALWCFSCLRPETVGDTQT